MPSSSFSPVRLVRGLSRIQACFACFNGRTADILCCPDCVAERVGFEPTLPFRVNTLSKRAPSATRPSLRLGSRDGNCSGNLSQVPRLPHTFSALFDFNG